MVYSLRRINSFKLKNPQTSTLYNFFSFTLYPARSRVGWEPGDKTPVPHFILILEAGWEAILDAALCLKRANKIIKYFIPPNGSRAHNYPACSWTLMSLHHDGLKLLLSIRESKTILQEKFQALHPYSLWNIKISTRRMINWQPLSNYDPRQYWFISLDADEDAL